MNQNIKNFIEEGEKEFDKIEITGIGEWKTSADRNNIKQFISSRQISLIKMIVEMCEEESEILNAYSSDDLQDARNSGGIQALDTISSKLKTLIKE